MVGGLIDVVGRRVGENGRLAFIYFVYRRVAQEPKFSLALTGSSEMHHIYNTFIQETEPIFGK